MCTSDAKRRKPREVKRRSEAVPGGKELTRSGGQEASCSNEGQGHLGGRR